jgi:hypothetical protein
MPPKLFQCDFCDVKQRKFDLPNHIKTKHVKELANYLVEEAKLSNISVISSYLRKADPMMMPIPSRYHEDTDYWFGTSPIMAEEKDSVSSYLASAANMSSHAEFIHEIMDNVSLNDYMAIQKNLIVRSEEMLRMKDRIKDLEKSLSTTIDEHDKEMESMSIELNAHRKTVEELNDGVLNTDLRAQIDRAERAQKFSESHATKTLEQLSTLQWKYKNLEQKYEDTQLSSVSSSNMKNLEMEEAYIKQIERLQDSLRKEREKTLTVKKTEKDSDKKKSEREKIKREMKEAKKRMRALQKTLSSSSDSDSDSDSD